MPNWRNYFTPRIRRLGGYCATGLFVGYGACYLMYKYTQVKVVTSSHCQNALEILLSHKEAVAALGAPVGLHAKFDFADKRSYKVDQAKKTFWIKLPVTGQLDSGLVYVDGVFDDNDKFQVTKMDLSLKRLEKRFRIFELADDDISVGKHVKKASDDDYDDDLEKELARSESKPNWFSFSRSSKNA